MTVNNYRFHFYFRYENNSAVFMWTVLHTQVAVMMCPSVDISRQCNPARDVNAASLLLFWRLHMDWTV